MRRFSIWRFGQSLEVSRACRSSPFAAAIDSRAAESRGWVSNAVCSTPFKVSVGGTSPSAGKKIVSCPAQDAEKDLGLC